MASLPPLRLNDGPGSCTHLQLTCIYAGKHHSSRGIQNELGRELDITSPSLQEAPAASLSSKKSPSPSLASPPSLLLSSRKPPRSEPSSSLAAPTTTFFATELNAYAVSGGFQNFAPGTPLHSTGSKMWGRRGRGEVNETIWNYRVNSAGLWLVGTYLCDRRVLFIWHL